MTEHAKSSPIPCRKCEKLNALQVEPGSQRRTCVECGSITERDVRPVETGWEIRPSLYRSRSLSHESCASQEPG